jgi:hypothetical protein
MSEKGQTHHHSCLPNLNHFMNSLKRDNSRRAAAESQLAENMARPVIVIAWEMSSFFNSHTPYILGLISGIGEGERNMIAQGRLTAATNP